MQRERPNPAEASPEKAFPGEAVPDGARPENAYLKCSNFSKAIGCLVCFLVALLEAILSEKGMVSLAAFAIYFSIVGADKLARFAYFRRRSDMVAGLVAALFLVAFVAALVVLWIRGQ